MRFHRYCVIGFYLAALSCLLVGLPVLVIGLLGRDAPTPASCCSLALIEGQGICTLAAQAQAQAPDKASPDVTVDAGAAPAASQGTSPEPGQAAPSKPPLASRRQDGREQV